MTELVEEVARAICCPIGCNAEREGRECAALTHWIDEATALLPILARQRNEGIEAAAKVADELGGVRENLAENLAFAAQHTRARTIATAIRALKEPE